MRLALNVQSNDDELAVPPARGPRLSTAELRLRAHTLYGHVCTLILFQVFVFVISSILMLVIFFWFLCVITITIFFCIETCVYISHFICVQNLITFSVRLFDSAEQLSQLI